MNTIIKKLEDNIMWARLTIDHEYPDKINKERLEHFILKAEEAIKILKEEQWVEFDFDTVSTHPPKYGKYFVKRKDGKIHWETWNGSNWAYNGNVITHWRAINFP